MTNPQGIRKALHSVLLALGLGVAAWGAPGENRSEREPPGGAPALEQRAYVWQRVWTDVLRRDLREHASAFATLEVLAAEIDFRGEAPAVSFAAADWSLLKQLGVPVALVVRIGPRQRTWGKSPDAVACVTGVCRRVLQLARTAGITPTELQIDYDAATAQLRDYRALVTALRPGLAGVPLVITTLPTWLESADFPALIAATDGYVLQLHALNKPHSLGVPVTLFDLARSRAWIAKAGELRRPFRVALPAYGYRVGFGADGRFLGLQAEGAARTWPAETTFASVWAEPGQVASLVADLRRERPAGCGAISWFRFPCAADEFSWRWETLAAVMRGERPRERWAGTSRPQVGGAVDIGVANTGSARASLRLVRVKWVGGGLIAADGIGGWRAERVSAGEVVFRSRSDEANEVQPGDAIDVGWVRLADPGAGLTIAPR